MNTKAIREAAATFEAARMKYSAFQSSEDDFHRAKTAYRHALDPATVKELCDAADANAWISVEDRLPEKNLRVLVWLEGFSEHSGVTWRRCGTDIMHRWPDEKETDRNGWPNKLIDAACGRLDADMLEVIKWKPINPPEAK